MRYKVKEIGEGGLDIRIPVAAAWLEAECADADIRPGDAGVELTGRLERSGEDFLLRGALRGEVITQCARCLEPARVPLNVDIAVSYVESEDDDKNDPFAGGEEDEPDVLTFQGGVIDLGPELRDEILMAIPMGPLCSDECAGICSVCGGNRNSTPCDCEERQNRVTSKLSVLKDMKV